MNDAIEILEQICKDFESHAENRDDELFFARMVANVYDAEMIIKKYS